jgi:hypothetical protein
VNGRVVRMANKAEAMAHMKLGGLAVREDSGTMFRYRCRNGEIEYTRFSNPGCVWTQCLAMYFADGYTLLPIEPVDMLTPEERMHQEHMRTLYGEVDGNIMSYVRLVDRLAPKPVKPIPQWVEAFASNLDEVDRRVGGTASFSGIAANIRAAARKAMEEGHG